MRTRRVIALILLLATAFAGATWAWPLAGRSVLASIGLATTDRATQAQSRVRAALTERLNNLDARWGAPILLRLFKQERTLEIWAQTDSGQLAKLGDWPICTYSGALGPKLREGDGQAPEGFYSVGARQLNPNSAYHLSFDLGFPNAYDRAQGRTGSYLMVHGHCVSIGCYAMGDEGIEDIYTLVAAALAGGQRTVPVLALPFRFDADWERHHADSPWLDFWRDLAAIDAQFERTRMPPSVRVVRGRYTLATTR